MFVCVCVCVSTKCLKVILNSVNKRGKKSNSIKRQFIDIKTENQTDRQTHQTKLFCSSDRGPYPASYFVFPKSLHP